MIDVLSDVRGSSDGIAVATDINGRLYCRNHSAAWPRRYLRNKSGRESLFFPKVLTARPLLMGH